MLLGAVDNVDDGVVERVRKQQVRSVVHPRTAAQRERRCKRPAQAWIDREPTTRRNGVDNEHMRGPSGRRACANGGVARSQREDVARAGRNDPGLQHDVKRASSSTGTWDTDFVSFAITDRCSCISD